MKNVNFKRGGPIDEKRIAYIEEAVAKLCKVPFRKVTALITPYPITASVDGNHVGPFFDFMFPCNGKIVKAAVDVGTKPKVPIELTAEISNSEGGLSNTFIISNNRIIVEPDIPVRTFDKLTLSMYHTEETEKFVRKLNISLLWIPHVKSVEVKNFLREDFDD